MTTLSESPSAADTQPAPLDPHVPQGLLPELPELPEAIARRLAGTSRDVLLEVVWRLAIDLARAHRLRDDPTSTETRAAVLLDLALQQVSG